jgi:hypothetical protein
MMGRHDPVMEDIPHPRLGSQKTHRVLIVARITLCGRACDPGARIAAQCLNCIDAKLWMPPYQAHANCLNPGLRVGWRDTV